MEQQNKMNNFQSFLTEHDFAADVIGAYEDYREKQLCPVKQAVDNVREDFSACLDDVDDRPVFWIALAFATAKRKELTKSILKNALLYLESSYFKERYAEPFDFENELEEIKRFFENGIGT